MNRRRFFVGAAVGGIITIAGCLETGGSDGPEESLNAFEQAITNQDIDQTNELISRESNIGELSDEDFPNSEVKFSLENRTVIESTDDRHIFELEERYSIGEVTRTNQSEYELVIEDGEWRILEAGSVTLLAEIGVIIKEIEAETDEKTEKEIDDITSDLEEMKKEMEEEIEEMEEMEGEIEEEMEKEVEEMNEEFGEPDD